MGPNAASGHMVAASGRASQFPVQQAVRDLGGAEFLSETCALFAIEQQANPMINRSFPPFRRDDAALVRDANPDR